MFEKNDQSKESITTNSAKLYSDKAMKLFEVLYEKSVQGQETDREHKIGLVQIAANKSYDENFTINDSSIEKELYIEKVTNILIETLLEENKTLSFSERGIVSLYDNNLFLDESKVNSGVVRTLDGEKITDILVNKIARKKISRFLRDDLDEIVLFNKCGSSYKERKSKSQLITFTSTFYAEFSSYIKQYTALKKSPYWLNGLASFLLKKGYRFNSFDDFHELVRIYGEVAALSMSDKKNGRELLYEMIRSLKFMLEFDGKNYLSVGELKNWENYFELKFGKESITINGSSYCERIYNTMMKFIKEGHSKKERIRDYMEQTVPLKMKHKFKKEDPRKNFNAKEPKQLTFSDMYMNFYIDGFRLKNLGGVDFPEALQLALDLHPVKRQIPILRQRIMRKNYTHRHIDNRARRSIDFEKTKKYAQSVRDKKVNKKSNILKGNSYGTPIILEGSLFSENCVCDENGLVFLAQILLDSHA